MLILFRYHSLTVRTTLLHNSKEEEGVTSTSSHSPSSVLPDGKFEKDDVSSREDKTDSVSEDLVEISVRNFISEELERFFVEGLTLTRPTLIEDQKSNSVQVG